MTTQCLHIPGAAGRLESLYTPAVGDRPAVCIAPPDPRFGGSIDSDIVRATARGFTKRGFGALIVGYRGAGRSDGVFADVEEALADYMSALDWLIGRHRGAPAVILAGAGFGAFIALQAAFRRDAAHLFLVSPILRAYDHKPIRDRMLPTTILCGGLDHITPPEAVERLVGAARKKGPPLRLRVADEADHGFSGRHLGYVAGAAGRIADDMIG